MGITYRLGDLDIVDVTQSYPDNFPQVPLAEKDLIVIHHTVTPGDLNVAVLYAAHKQFGGIGYNALVYPSGKIVMTGQWNTARAGAAQLPSLNWRGYHIALVGDFSFVEPSIDALHAANRLIQNLEYARGARLPVAPHRLFNVPGDWPTAKWNTSCPGDTWLQWWGKVRGY